MRIKCILMVFLVLPLVGNAKDGFSSEDELSQWLMHYYIEPDPERIVTAVRYMSKSKMLDSKSSLPPIFGFLAGVFKENPDRAFIWAEELRAIKKTHYGVVVLGLWYANLPDSQQAIYKLIASNRKLQVDFEYLKKGAPMSVTDIPLEQGSWVLDALWGNYFATGKSEPVHRITEALPWQDIEGDTNRLVIGGAANWSLWSNSVQHEQVFQIVTELGKNQPENLYIHKILNEATEERKGRLDSIE